MIFHILVIVIVIVIFLDNSVQGGKVHEVIPISLAFFIIYGYITKSELDQLSVGLIAQLVEHCTGIAAVMGSNSV